MHQFLKYEAFTIANQSNVVQVLSMFALLVP
jgi:hypothetical protein